MKSYYAARAPEYDQIYLKPERQEDLRAIERWLPPHFSQRAVVEIACGTGYWTQFIAQVASSVVAIDAAPETMALAKGRMPEDKVLFVHGDAYSFPSHLGRFTAAFAGFWFSHIPKPRRREFLLGLNKVLEPGARVVFLDNRYVEGSSSPITELDMEENTYQTRKLEDGSSYRVLKNFPSEAELRSLVADLAEVCAFDQWKYYWAFQYEVQ